MFGVVPTGLNATGEGEIQVWYDWINASQINLFGPNLQILLNVVQLDLFGAIDPIRRLTDLLDGGDEQSDQDRNDGNDHQ